MPKPYSYDLRQKVIQAIKLDGFRGRQVPPNYYRQNFSPDRPVTKISAY
ncbi:hypothetical protein [Microcoleus vaginatus]